MKIFSKNTWGVDVNNAWPLACKASCLKKIELRPLISGFDFALLEVRNPCVASRLKNTFKTLCICQKVAGQIGPKLNRSQVKSAPVKSAPSQIGPRSNHCIIMVFFIVSLLFSSPGLKAM